jgi:hydrogenase expression/formation protein HypC
MCLGIPGKVVRTYREHDVLMGKVDFSGVVKQVCLEHVPEVQPGQFVLVHVGFALSSIDEAEAVKVFEFLRGMDQLDELTVPGGEPPGGSGAERWGQEASP